jgi:hypothetical protein
MREIEDGLENVNNLLDAAATDARDIQDLTTQLAVHHLIQAVAELKGAFVAAITSSALGGQATS